MAGALGHGDGAHGRYPGVSYFELTCRLADDERSHLYLGLEGRLSFVGGPLNLAHCHKQLAGRAPYGRVRDEVRGSIRVESVAEAAVGKLARD